MSSARASVAPDKWKASAILSNTAVRRSAVDQEDLKPYRKSEKCHISWGDHRVYYLQVFTIFPFTPLLNIDKYSNHRWDLPTRFHQTHITGFS